MPGFMLKRSWPIATYTDLPKASRTLCHIDVGILAGLFSITKQPALERQLALYTY